MKVDIPFNDWSRVQLAKTKRATSRTKKYGSVGDTFEVKLFHRLEKVKYQLTYIERVTLGFVAEHLYELEGANSQQELIDVWIKLHPLKGFEKDQKVYLHVFKEV